MSKNIVIVGASAAGATIAKELAKKLPEEYRVIVIEENNFAFWPIGALRAAVQPGFESSVVEELDGLFPQGSRHLLLKGIKVVSIQANVVTLEKSTSEFPDATVPYERGVMAQGSTYAFPCRPASSNLVETLSALRTLQGQIEACKSVLISGGGPVGVEFAGEVFSRYPGKKITLVTSSEMLIASMNNVRLHSKLLYQLERAGVRVILGQKIAMEDDSTRPLPSLTRFTTESNEEIEADFVFNGFGSRPNSDLVKQIDVDAVNEQGFVRVNDDLTIKSDIVPHLYAVGDVNELPGGKTYMAATGQAPVAAANILVNITDIGRKKKISPPPAVMAIPLGAKGGAIQLPFATLGEWTVSLIKGKTLFVSQFASTYR